MQDRETKLEPESKENGTETLKWAGIWGRLSACLASGAERGLRAEFEVLAQTPTWKKILDGLGEHLKANSSVGRLGVRQRLMSAALAILWVFDERFRCQEQDGANQRDDQGNLQENEKMAEVDEKLKPLALYQNVLSKTEQSAPLLCPTKAEQPNVAKAKIKNQKISNLLACLFGTKCLSPGEMIPVLKLVSLGLALKTTKAFKCSGTDLNENIRILAVCKEYEQLKKRFVMVRGFLSWILAGNGLKYKLGSNWVE